MVPTNLKVRQKPAADDVRSGSSPYSASSILHLIVTLERLNCLASRPIAQDGLNMLKLDLVVCFFIHGRYHSTISPLNLADQQESDTGCQI
jgi:hypothetical protein